MSSITVTHAPSGLVHANVARTERVTPHMVRVTLTGDDLRRFDYRGFDQWFRLAVPVDDHARFDNLPDKFDTRSYLRYLVLPKSTRPVIRNYTVRAFRPDELELDIDFVCHGTAGVAGPWAESVEPGTEVAFIDQGCGWAPVPADWSLLVADESGLPAVLGILRDMPRDAVGHAIVELIDAADAQDVDAPAGMTLHWVLRAATAAPRWTVSGRWTWLPRARRTCSPSASRRSPRAPAGTLVGERGVPKGNVTFCGYWKAGKA